MTVTSLFGLANKIALITGSTRGIGEGIARQMARHGARVVISSRKSDSCLKVAAELNAEFGAKTAISVPCHVGDRGQIEDLVKQTRVPSVLSMYWYVTLP